MSAARKTVRVQRTGPVLLPDRTRLLLRPFRPESDHAVRRIVERVMALSEDEVGRTLKNVLGQFSGRHEQMDAFLRRRFEDVRGYLAPGPTPSPERQRLIAACFTQEYAFEAAALLNPSIVAHPDQTGLPPGALRFVLSLRAIGEGHISSITFRTGLISPQQRISLLPPEPFVSELERIPNATYERALFSRKLGELGLLNDFAQRAMDPLPDAFTISDLRGTVAAASQNRSRLDAEADPTARVMLLLAESNYEVRFSAEQRMSQRVLFPTAPSESNGIEDARFVRFQNDDGTITYYATYTAYDGRIILPQLIETADFNHFRFSTLNGPAVRNKGLALFPRKVNGRYAMLSRQDDERLFLMYSDHPHFWYEAQPLLEPREPWELVKIGNCGSPLETEAGWLVLTHGVGPMRKYCVGACLLDLHDPGRVIGRLRQPLLEPNELEREGYVPNVVYTCGALLHEGVLILPYAMSDAATSFATVPLADVLEAME
jgi:predicted GH43/DUF377 family glycosyl hydrolase